MRAPHLLFGLKRFHRQLAGERAFISRPVTRIRTAAGRASYTAEAAHREARVAEIDGVLPHVEFLLKLLDPSWDADGAKPIRPPKVIYPQPPYGWWAAAFDELRNADRPLTGAELVEASAQRYGVDISEYPARQRASNAVWASLGKNRNLLVRHEGPPLRFELLR